MQTNETSSTPRLYSVDQFSERNPALKRGQLRWLIFQADSNGLEQAGAIIRLGRRVFLDEGRFFEWLLAQQKQRKVA